MKFIDLGFLGFPRYCVSDTGVVWNKESDSEVKQLSYKTRKTYKRVTLYGISWEVHRLVAICFIPNPDNYSEILHLDGNIFNNCVDNLKWVKELDNKEDVAKFSDYRSSMTDKIVHAICKDLEDGLGSTEISRKYDVSNDAVYLIKKGSTWKNISSLYNIDKPNAINSRLTDDKVRLICEKFKSGMTNLEISKELDISKEVVRKITNGTNWKHITKDYF